MGIVPLNEKDCCLESKRNESKLAQWTYRHEKQGLVQILVEGLILRYRVSMNKAAHGECFGDPLE